MSNTEISIIGVLLLSITVLITLRFHKTAYGQEKDRSARIKEMTLDALFLALVLVMTFVPNLGYISFTPLLTFTLMHLPVLLAAMIGGWRKGLLVGFFFGCSSFAQALTSTSAFNLLFIYPWVSIPPRMLFGFVAGLVFSLIGKLHKGPLKGLYLGLASAGLTLLHTSLVFLDLFIFFPDIIVAMFSSTSPLEYAPAFTMFTGLLVGVAGEMIIAGVVMPPLMLAITKAMPHLFKRKH